MIVGESFPRYSSGMPHNVLRGTAHSVPGDLKAAIRAETDLGDLWRELTPLGRKEFICCIENSKQAETRKRRIERLIKELREGKRRPCCWTGCIHRTDNLPGQWQQAVLIDGKQC